MLYVVLTLGPYWIPTGICGRGNHSSPLVLVVSSGVLRLPSDSGGRGTKSKDTVSHNRL